MLERGGGTPRLVLVGGGDPFLLSSPKALWGTSTEATYAPPKADVVTLARQTARRCAPTAYGGCGSATTTACSADRAENPHWRADYIPDDVVSPITSLWVDEGRDPIGYGRVSDPSLTAAAVFAEALAAEGITVVGTPEPTVSRPRCATRSRRSSSATLAQIVAADPRGERQRGRRGAAAPRRPRRPGRRLVRRRPDRRRAGAGGQRRRHARQRPVRRQRPLPRERDVARSCWST